MTADRDSLARRESRKSKLAFADYCTLGAGRSLDALLAQYVAQALSGRRPPTTVRFTMHEWSRRHDWVRRAAAYDVDLHQQARLAQIEAVRDMNERHINLARVMMMKVAQRLQSLDPAELSPTEVARWADTCSKLERLARGEATERVDVFARVRELAKQFGLSETEEAEAVAAAERIVRGGA